MKSTTLGSKGIVHYKTMVLCGKDKFRCTISDLPNWAVPPPQAFLGVIQSAMEASDIK